MTRRQDNLAALIANVVGRPQACAVALLRQPQPGTQRHRILVRLLDGAATDTELADSLGLNPSSVRPRRVALADAGLIEPAGRRNRSTVWTLTDEGEALARHPQ